MRRFTVLSALFGLLVALLPAAPAAAHGKPECHPTVGVRQVDPIVERGSVTSDHRHEFAGNTAFLSLSRPDQATYTQLVGQPTSCENPDDSALYWWPTMLRNGQELRARAVIAYYRSWDFDRTTSGTVAFPPDARLVARVTNWTCGANSSRPGPFSSPQVANCGLATGNVRLTAHVDFPTCWDGRLNDHAINGNTADFSDLHNVTQHFKYTSAGKGSRGGTCPAGYTQKVPALRLAIAFGDAGYTGAYWRNATLATSHGGTNFANFHSDFWNTWRQTGGIYGGLTGFVTRCVNVSSGHPHGQPIANCGN